MLRAPASVPASNSVGAAHVDQLAPASISSAAAEGASSRRPRPRSSGPRRSRRDVYQRQPPVRHPASMAHRRPLDATSTICAPEPEPKEHRNHDARSRDRRRRPQPDRARVQGIPRPASPRGDRRLRRRQAARAQPGRLAGARSRTSTAAAACRRACRPSTSPGSSSLLSEQLPQTVTGDDDLALLRLVARRDPPRRERDQGRRGRRLRRRRGRVRQPLQRAHRARRRRRPQPEPDRRERPAERLHRHGPDRGQRREEVRGQPRRHGQVRAALAGARRRLAGGRLLRPRDRPGDRPGRQRGRQGRRAARLARRSRSSPSCPRRSATAASPPATRARSTTAPPRCW